MAQLSPLGREQIYPLPSEEHKTFAGQPTPCRISGPGGLARLVMNGRPVTTPGKLSFWFDEAIFTRLREKAKMDLQSQGLSKRSPTSNPFRQLVGMYMKHCFRSDLAFCKNWTEDFDSYAILPLRPNDSLVAWAGKIQAQPYFDPNSRPTRSTPDLQAAHALAEKNGIRLIGGQQQYVVDIDYPKNVTLKSRILGPFPF
jgi:hypothetical protein